MGYTKEQQRVIDERDKNILVSAAAGSGKTAVLKERIVSLITDPERPMDVDHILVLTYTTAAAAEMRERIDGAISEALSKNPEDNNLQKQKLLLQNAQIATIHSFCLFVLRNNFGDIGLDPGFRNLDEGERKILLRDTLEEILERYYKEADEDFIRLVECYASDIGEGTLEDTILDIHEFLLSLTKPEDWINSSREDYKVSNISEIENRKWWKEGILPVIDYTIKEAVKLAKKGLEISLMEDGPSNSTNGFREYLNLFEDLDENRDYASRYKALSGLTTIKFPDSRKADANLKRKAKTIKEYLKDCHEDLIKKYYISDADTFAYDCKLMEKPVSKLLEIVEALRDEFSQVKRKKNLIDFSDMEHLTLKILVDDEGNPTNTAKEYSQYFDAVMVDEYQDINEVQESILTSITKDNNYFMVGDVKQSIYRFRQAKPEIFIDKYDSFLDDGINTKIELNKNFRSRPEVLDFTNLIFSKAMKKSVSKIEYDDNASLKFGATCYEKKTMSSYKAEIMLMDKPDDETRMLLSLSDDNRSAEARMVADKIQELVSSGCEIYDKEKEGYRPISYKDIVVLTFSVSRHGELLKHTFESLGIPVVTESKSGYFNAEEIRTVLNLLEVINNPTGEILLYGCLTGFFGKLTEEEVANVKAAFRGEPLYDAVISYMEGNEDNIAGYNNLIAHKLSEFMNMIDEYRYMTTYMGVRDILDRIVISSGYIDYVLAKKGGVQKRANVLLLLEKATSYEKTSFHGLFRFVRYIKGLKAKDADFGEAITLDESEDAVRIMTIHKSKGLEYPVCFIYASDETYLEKESRKSAVLDPELGIAVDSIDPDRRIRRKSVKKAILTRKAILENRNEQLRVLYVALTRAREKMYITGSISSTAKEKEKGISAEDKFIESLVPEDMFIESNMLSYTSYLSIISNVISSKGLNAVYFRFYTADDIKTAKIKKELATGITKEEILSDSLKVDTAYLNEITSRIGYKYRYDYMSRLKSKVSVSDLKKAAIHNLDESIEDEEGALIEDVNLLPISDENGNINLLPISDENGNINLYAPEESKEQTIDKYIPSFIREDKSDRVPKSLVGSACHRLMELIDYKSIKCEEDGSISAKEARRIVDETIAINRENGKLDNEYCEIILSGGGTGFISKTKAESFFNSNLAKEMIKADIAGKLYREKSFFMGIPFKEVDSTYPDDEDVLIQGIIDVYYELPDGTIALADYKTDSLKNIQLNGGYGGNGQEVAKTEAQKLDALVSRYRTQLDLYARAIERVTGKTVSKKIIYAFDLEKEIIF